MCSQLYKGAEEDVIQLYDLSILPQNHTAGDHRSTCGPMSSLMKKGRKESLFSLGTLLYRVAHRMSLSKVLAKCLFSLLHGALLIVSMYMLCRCLVIEQNVRSSSKNVWTFSANRITWYFYLSCHYLSVYSFSCSARNLLKIFYLIL